MASLKPFVLLLLAFGIISAFSVSDYLRPTEAKAVVQFTNFTLGNTSYSIVSINGANTFLLSNGNIVPAKPDIQAALKSYYSTYYLPSPVDLENLQTLIQSYNYSRNDGGVFKGQEESACLGSLFIDGRVPWDGQPVVCRNESDDALCQVAANLMFQYLSAATGGTAPVAAPSDLYAPIQLFGFASYGTSTILNTDTSMLEAAEADPTKTFDALTYMENTTPQLAIYKAEMENNLFTLTVNGTTNQNHWGICPDISLNGSALSAINTTVTAMSVKTAPYQNLDSTSTAIANNTATRLAYFNDKTQAQTYGTRFASLNASGSAAITLGQSAVAHVSSADLSSDLDNLTALQATIPEDIAANDFTNLDSELSQYGNLTIEVKNLSSSALDSYNKALNAKTSANSMLLMVETSDSNFVTMNTLGVLQNETQDLDARFRDGLTPSQFDALASNYTAIESSATPLLNDSEQPPATRLLAMFRGFTRRVNVGIDNIAVQTDISPQSIPKGIVPLGAFSALVLLSFSSIAILAFLYIFSSIRFSVPKTGHILAVAFLCAMIALASFTVFMFIFLGKTSTDANLQEFMSDFSTKNSTAIFIDLSNTSSVSDANAMQSCASILADSLEAQNKTWSMYTITPSACTLTPEKGANSSLAVGTCANLSGSAPSSFVLSYSQTDQVPKFTIIYQDKALIQGNADYYNSCPLVAFFN